MSAARQKGTAFETSVTRYLQEFWYPDAHRNPLHGSKDVGDIWLPDKRFVLELKAVRKMDLPGWTREAQAEARNLNDHAVGVVVHKRTGVAAPGQQWVAMELDDLMTLVNVLSEPSTKAFR